MQGRSAAHGTTIVAPRQECVKPTRAAVEAGLTPVQRVGKNATVSSPPAHLTRWLTVVPPRLSSGVRAQRVGANLVAAGPRGLCWYRAQLRERLQPL